MLKERLTVDSAVTADRHKIAADGHPQIQARHCSHNQFAPLHEEHVTRMHIVSCRGAPLRSIAQSQRRAAQTSPTYIPGIFMTGLVTTARLSAKLYFIMSIASVTVFDLLELKDRAELENEARGCLAQQVVDGIRSNEGCHNIYFGRKLEDHESGILCTR